MLISRFKKWIARRLLAKGYTPKEVVKYSRLSKSTVYRMKADK